MLVMPFSEALELPESVKDMAWARMPDTTLDDPLLRRARPVLEAEIGAYGFSVLPLIDQSKQTARQKPIWKRWMRIRR